MKNPNGYGSVVKLSGNRRKPFVVRKTTGWNDKGYPIYDIIGYTATREEGNILLAEYNKMPWDVDRAKITLQELFDLWLEKKWIKLGKSNQGSLKSAYNHIKKISDMKYIDIKAYHMQDCIDNCGRGASTQSSIKSLFGHLEQFALELDIESKSYSELLTTAPAPQSTKTRFTDEEIKKVWQTYHDYKNGKNFGDIPIELIDIALILLYTGFRISELLFIKTKDIDLKEMTFKGGIKTEAGKNRIVPIHSAILEIVKNRYNARSEYFIKVYDERVSADKFRKLWKELMNHLEINKMPHECRHTFESVLDSAGANRKCIDLMMGHSSKDIGNRVYNHKTLSELKEALELFKVN